MAQIAIMYYDNTEHARIVAAIPHDRTVAIVEEAPEFIDYLQFADERPELIAFDTSVIIFDGLLLCARMRELCPRARLLPLGMPGDTTTALAHLGCLPPVDERDPNLPALLRAALDAPPPPPPDALVRALIEEARIAEAHMRLPHDRPETLIYATTAARAQALRAQFCGQGPVYVAANLDELRLILNEAWVSRFVATVEDAPLAEPMIRDDRLERIIIKLRPEPTWPLELGLVWG
jgi:hypothetical protein